MILAVILIGSVSFFSGVDSAKAQLLDEDAPLSIGSTIGDERPSEETASDDTSSNEEASSEDKASEEVEAEKSLNEPEGLFSDTLLSDDALESQPLEVEPKLEADLNISDTRAVREAMLGLNRRLAEYESLNRAITEQIERLENDNHFLKERVSALETAFASLQKEHRLSLLESSTQKEELSKDQARVAPNKTENEVSDEALGETSKDVSDDAEVKIEGAATAETETNLDTQITPEATSQATTKTEAVPLLSPAQKLLLAETQLASGEAPEDVAEDLKALLRDAPDYERSSVALYLLGETYLLRKMYEEATATYAASYKKSADPGQSKDRAAASLFKLSFSLGRQGERAKSCLALAKLRRDYKNLERRLSVRANRLSETYGCETYNSE